jgi:hypothetical protein
VSEGFKARVSRPHREGHLTCSSGRSQCMPVHVETETNSHESTPHTDSDHTHTHFLPACLPCLLVSVPLYLNPKP